MLGITEPAIFGVNLKLKFPFICGMIAAGIASFFIGLFHVLAVAMGPKQASLALFPLHLVRFLHS